MPRHGAWRALAGSLALAGASLLSGCLGFVHPVKPPEHSELALCEGIPQQCKNHVHVFLLHGLDPLDLGNLDGLCDYLHSIGYIKTHFGLPFHSFLFEKEIRKLHATEPTSRFVLIGFSYSAGLVRDIACDMGRAGIPADLLVYIDGVAIHQRPLDRPANALRVVNILSCFRSAERQVKEAANVHYDDVWHFGAPTHPLTLKLLTDELAVIAGRVPIVEPALPPVRPEDLPPRPAPPRLPSPLPPGTLPPPLPEPSATSKMDGWDFLEPDNHATGVPGSKPLPEAWATDPATWRER